jgi:hypothetical protein
VALSLNKAIEGLEAAAPPDFDEQACVASRLVITQDDARRPRQHLRRLHYHFDPKYGEERNQKGGARKSFFAPPRGS